MILRVCATILVLALLAPNCAASSLATRPSPPPLTDLFAGLSSEERRGMIDVQESVLKDDSRAPDAELHFRLGLLHLAEGDPLSRNLALEAFTQARLLAPDRLDILLWRAEAHARMKQVLAAIHLLESETDRFEDDPGWAYALGYYHWVRALHFMERSNFETSRSAFLRAARARPQVLQYRLALAAAGLMIGDWETVLAATVTLHEGETVAVPALLLRACGQQGAGNDAAAHELFQRAFVSMPEDLVAAFLAAQRFLPSDVEDSAGARGAYWRAMDPHPARPENGRRLEFFRRMVEADLLFGGDEGYGWESQMGEAWVRWGRPTGAQFEAAEISPFAARSRPSPGVTGGARAHARQPTNTLSDRDPNMHRWHWFYGFGEDAIELTFVDASFNYEWSLSSGGAHSFLALQNEKPLLFVEHRPPPNLDLFVAASGFHRGPTQTVLEATVAVLPQEDFVATDEGRLVNIEWALYDHRRLIVDRGVVPMNDQRWRAHLLEMVGLRLDENELNPLIARVGLLLEPGDYRLAVEAIHERTGAQQTALVDFSLGALPTDALVLSDLEIADSFHPYDSNSAVPLEFVKHAQVILPNAQRSFPIGSRRAYVYYEVDGLVADERGSTHFDVSYAIEPIEEDAGPSPVGSQFLSEETGTSPDQKVIKGTRLDLTGLAAGAYRLRVQIDDLVAGRSAERTVRFDLFDPSARAEAPQP